MRPTALATKIFLDGGDPQETKQVLALLGFLDGQTTNPTLISNAVRNKVLTKGQVLISKNPQAKARLERGEKFSKGEIFAFYKKVVQEISPLLPHGSVSIEIYADRNTRSEDMLWQAREMFSWIPNAHIKFPTMSEGLRAASQAVKEGMRVNMTLCFSQEQAAAVYSATKGAKCPDVFVSPFVGRLDDKGENGMSLIENIIRMYQRGDGHVKVLTASVRNLSRLLQAMKVESDIITSPFAVLKEWYEQGMPLTFKKLKAISSRPEADLKPIPYDEIDLEKEWREYNIAHELTDAGIERFSQDWNALIR